MGIWRMGLLNDMLVTPVSGWVSDRTPLAITIAANGRSLLRGFHDDGSAHGFAVDLAVVLDLTLLLELYRLRRFAPLGFAGVERLAVFVRHCRVRREGF